MSAEVSAGPLERSGKALLILSASVTILLCYLFSLVSILALLVWILLEIALFVVLLRFGFGGVMLNYIQRHASLVSLFVRNLWLPRGVDYYLPLRRDDAPELFAMLDGLALRLKIRPPDEVRAEMNCGAWVRLHGLHSGAGRTILGIGYDLLAALDLSEIEAVMAHEMAHAKLVHRGLKSWLNGGLARIVRLSNALGDLVAAYRAQNQNFHLASQFRRGADSIARLAARLVSAYSRQDEFEADRGAAELCGREPLRTSLLRLDLIEPRLARLPWSERTGRAETEPTFSGWLVSEFHVPASEVVHVPGTEVRDPYSTHPSIADRLAAMPPGPDRPRDATSALSLLRQPDHVAASLIEEVHRIVAIEEQKDAKALEKLTRRQLSTTSLGWGHLPSLLLLTGAIVALIFFFMDMPGQWPALPVALVFFAGSYWALRLARYKDRRRLPVPRYSELKKAWSQKTPPDLKALESALEKEFSAWSGRSRRSRVRDLVRESYDSLGRCDYLRAHVASRFALDVKNTSIEAALANAIASASLHMHGHVGSLLTFLKSKTGLSSSQTVWGAAWACLLAGDWANAEAYLLRKQRDVPDESTFALLLALAQQRRGKLQSAVINAERGAALAPDDHEALKLYALCLLDAGRPRAAADRLLPLEDSARSDAELALCFVRLRLIQRDLASAREWAAIARQVNDETSLLITLGGIFESSRLDDDAADFYLTAVSRGFYPAARLGLARIAACRKEWPMARQHLLEALNMDKELPEDAAGPIPLFGAILDQLMQLDQSRQDCQAWIATFPLQPMPVIPEAFRGCRLLVYATTHEQAVTYVDEILRAVQTKSLPAPAASLTWAAAPKDQQPIRPVFPGAQLVLSGS